MRSCASKLCSCCCKPTVTGASRSDPCPVVHRRQTLLQSPCVVTGLDQPPVHRRHQSARDGRCTSRRTTARRHDETVQIALVTYRLAGHGIHLRGVPWRSRFRKRPRGWRGYTRTLATVVSTAPGAFPDGEAKAIVGGHLDFREMCDGHVRLAVVDHSSRGTFKLRPFELQRVHARVALRLGIERGTLTGKRQVFLPQLHEATGDGRPCWIGRWEKAGDYRMPVVDGTYIAHSRPPPRWVIPGTSIADWRDTNTYRGRCGTAAIPHEGVPVRQDATLAITTGIRIGRPGIFMVCAQ